MHMHHIAIWGLPDSTVFSRLFHKLHYFRTKVTKQNFKFLFSLQLSSRTFHILRRNERDMIKMYIVFQLKKHLASPIIMKLEFSCQVSKILKYQILCKFVQWEQICFMWVDRRTDMTKLTVAFGNFWNAQNFWTTIQLRRFCVAKTRLGVLQRAVGSLQLVDCDTEWLIGINVVTGGVLCAADSSWFFTVSWLW